MSLFLFFFIVYPCLTFCKSKKRQNLYHLVIFVKTSYRLFLNLYVYSNCASVKFSCGCSLREREKDRERQHELEKRGEERDEMWERDGERKLWEETETGRSKKSNDKRRMGWRRADGGADGGLRGSLKENIREQKCVRSHVAERERFKMAERGSMTKRVQIFRVDQSS